MFQLKNISKKYGEEFAVKDITMSIKKGLNFIVGPSGSGKTTLLKIISGLEQSFEGTALYCDKDIKKLNNNEKSYLYNNVFGFVWQDFYLIENLTVFENVMLPVYLKTTQNSNNVKAILKSLGIYDMVDKKVKYLSGGQKQRVAIARELMKNPQVIIADEPTSALDEKSSKEVMKILREIAKNKMVIIVTHDISLITKEDAVFELDKGELIASSENNDIKSNDLNIKSSKLSLKNSFLAVKTMMKRYIGRTTIATISLLFSIVLLLTTFSGSINNTSKSEFEKLFKTYGESILDISIVNSFMSASGTGDNANDKPNADVSQNIRGLYDQYIKDDRVSFITYLQAIDNINVELNGKQYKIESSGSVPIIENMIVGRMPDGSGNEVIVPESFIKKIGIKPEEAIGKEIYFTGSINGWKNKTPIPEKISVNVKIVGVMDTTMRYEYEGKIIESVVEDSFLFSKSALDTMLKKIGKDTGELNFLIRAKTPEGLIQIKDELNKKGIVPLGQFELVEDIVRLNNQTNQQSGYANTIIAALSFVMVIVIFLVTGFMRKREYAIYKVSGFNTKHLLFMNFIETLMQCITLIILFVVASPIISYITQYVFHVNILNMNMIFIGIALAIGINIITYIINASISIKTNVTKTLKTGDK